MHLMMSVSIRLSMTLWVLCLAAGCGGSSSDQWLKDRPPVFPVQGKVLYKGAPVAEAMVSFGNPDPKKVRGASGQTDQNGEFRLTTFSPGDGAVVGEYQVTILKATVVGEDLSYYDQNSPNYGKDPPPTTLKYLVPEKYSKFKTSGLTAKVSDSGENDVVFELKD